jgi:hypothetical protein
VQSVALQPSLQRDEPQLFQAQFLELVQHRRLLSYHKLALAEPLAQLRLALPQQQAQRGKFCKELHRQLSKL